MPLTVQFDNIPSTGLKLEGQLEDNIFDLGDPSIQPAGPVSYNLIAYTEDGALIVSGQLSAPFTLECTRCLSPFPFTVSLPDYRADLPLENAQIVDLTDQVREDILLALPGYPKCEQATGDDRSCPKAGNFDGSDRENTATEASGRSEVWDILNELPKSDDQSSQ